MTEKKVPEWIDESDNNFWLSEVNLLYDNVVESIQRTRNKVVGYVRRYVVRECTIGDRDAKSRGE